jgi:hypothetical protein
VKPTPAVPGRFGLATVRGVSMQPTLYDGDILLVRYRTPRSRPLAAGTLAVLRLPPGPDGTARPISVKRVTGPAPSGQSGWWVERDNPAAGVDSWSVGAIADDDVLATVVAGLWPPRVLWRVTFRRRGGRQPG